MNMRMHLRCGLLVTVALLTGLTLSTAAFGQDQPPAPPPGGSEGQRPPPPDMAAAAKELGVTEQALMEALGPPPPNVERAAQALGIPAEQLQEVLRKYGPRQPPGMEGEGGGPLAAAAKELGITEQALKDAVGPPPPNVERASQILGIPAEKLDEVLRKYGPGQQPPPKQ
jgi:lambda repressor-like predicted transcriptional regulator